MRSLDAFDLNVLICKEEIPLLNECPVYGLNGADAEGFRTSLPKTRDDAENDTPALVKTFFCRTTERLRLREDKGSQRKTKILLERQPSS